MKTKPLHKHGIGAALSNFNDKSLVLTGGKKHPLKAECYDVLRDTWRELKPMKNGRYHHASCVLSSGIYSFWGYLMLDHAINVKINDSIEFLSCDPSINDFTDLVDWVLITGFEPLFQLEPSVCPLNNDQIVVFGGYRDQKNYYQGHTMSDSIALLEMRSGQVQYVT